MTGQIVSKIYGGLGNQIFQYAMGRAMALRSQSTLLLDKRFFDTNAGVTFRLGHFNTTPALTSGRLPPVRQHEKVRYRLWKTFGLKPQLLREKGLAFHPELIEPRSDVWLDGYWQSERYFADVAEIIRDDLRVITPPSAENQKHLAMLAEAPAISLHVRRGDYMLPENQTLFAACSESYYAKALDLIAESMAEEPVVYVFSDDPA